MKLSGLKIGIAAIAAMILVGTAWLCLMPAPKPSLRLFLVSTTNEVQTGTCWGVFRLENKTTNNIGVVSGYALPGALAVGS